MNSSNPRLIGYCLSFLVYFSYYHTYEGINSVYFILAPKHLYHFNGFVNFIILVVQWHRPIFLEGESVFENPICCKVKKKKSHFFGRKTLNTTMRLSYKFKDYPVSRHLKFSKMKYFANYHNQEIKS